MLRIIKISVRNLVESVLRSGDIDDSYRSFSRALEGTRAHQKVQASYGEEYSPEYSLKYEMDYKNFKIQLQGRADGIFTYIDRRVIEEIKSTNLQLDQIEEDHNELHWAQAKCYGFIYMEENDLKNIEIKLTYFQLESEEIKAFYRSYSYEELKKFFYGLVDEYVSWANISFYWLEKRDSSIRELDFPFPSYRKGQRDLAVDVYGSIRMEKKIFVQAATGIGKTMSTLFPSIKSMGEGLSKKIFYLTAKTISRQAPVNSIRILEEKGLRIKTIVITAKEKICLNEEVSCNPKDCIYAKGHFDRINEAIKDIFKKEDLFTREVVEDYARKHRVCPFEFSLDLALWADLIISDYNYVFDPQVQLKRFFDLDREDYIFLIDEAHNLVDRGRMMYSAELTDWEIDRLIPIFKDEDRKIYNNLNRLVNIFDSLAMSLDIGEDYYQEEAIDDLYNPIKTSLSNLDKWLAEEKGHENHGEVLDLYFKLLSYNRIQDFYDDHFLTSYHRSGDGNRIKINCVDPSYLLAETMNKGRASVLFSATLSPLEYFKDLLGGNGRDYHISLPSPFREENQGVFISNLSTRYRDRERNLDPILDMIGEFVKARKGNYLIFFPSYKYMEEAYDLFLDRNSNLNLIIQDRYMSEEEREAYLEEFESSQDLIAFAVLGGIFSESIDLVGESLIGAAIVGVGMPRISFENNMIRDYYDKYLGQGFDYAYSYPGMNKVLQAGGRVIRSSKDRGVILLIDDRYLTYKYKRLFPTSWRKYKLVRSQMDLKRGLEDFWKSF